MSQLPLFAVFAPSREAFWAYAERHLHVVKGNSLRNEVETPYARYKLFDHHAIERGAARGYNFAGILLLKGFDRTAGAWDDDIAQLRWAMR